jgi:O-antigen/teichoic acid export membrane protein
MAQVVIGFASLFRDIGASTAIIRQKQLDDALLTSIFWLNLAMGLFATSACWLAAPFVARFYSEPGLRTVFQALSLYFLITAVSNVHGALMNRGLQFARIAAVELLAGAAGLIVGVVSAVRGAAVWSLIAGGAHDRYRLVDPFCCAEPLAAHAEFFQPTDRIDLGVWPQSIGLQYRELL